MTATPDQVIAQIRPLVREIKENLSGPPYVTVLGGVIIDALDAMEALAAERDALLKALKTFANASRIELVGIDGRRVYCTKADLYNARTLSGDKS